MNTGEGSSEEERERISAHIRTVLRKLSAPSRASREAEQKRAGSTQKGVKAEGEKHGS